MIRVVKASKIYNRGKPNQVNAVNDVGLNVERGEMTVIHGASGSGKTTLLTLIGCISRPTSGEIHVAGKAISRLPEKFMTLHRREHIGFIFQQFNLIQDLSVEQNMGLPLLPLDVSNAFIADQSEKLLIKMGLESRRGFPVRQLSGGEQQRVAIARALINDPGILLADEPTAHLDTNLANKMMEIMVSIKEEGRTIVIASHDPLVFNHRAVDRVFEMRDGRITEE